MRATKRMCACVALAVVLIAAVRAAAQDVKALPPPADAGKGLLFHASFDRDRRAEVATGADGPVMATYAHANRTIEGGTHVDGVFGKALTGRCGRLGSGAYDALGNFLADRGTVAFHVRQKGMVYGFELLMLNTVDPYYWTMYLRITGKGAGDIGAWFPNEIYRPETVYGRNSKLVEDQWRHVAVTWDQAYGARFYVDGEEAGSSWGKASWCSRGVDPDRIALAHNDGVAYDELYVFDRPLTAQQIRDIAKRNKTPAVGELPPLAFDAQHAANRLRELSWTTADPGMFAVDLGKTGLGANAIQQVLPTDARSVKKEGCTVFDGKLGNGWPPLYNYGFGNGNGLHVLVEKPYDQVNIEGYFRGPVFGRHTLEPMGEPIATIDSPMFMRRWKFDAPREAGWLSFFKKEMEDKGALPDKELVTAGRICEVGFFRRRAHDLADATPRTLFLGPADAQAGGKALGAEFIGRYSPGDRAVLAVADAPNRQPGGQAMPALRFHHVIVPAAEQPWGLRGVRLVLWLRGRVADSALRVEVRDPALPGRRLAACDFALTGGQGGGPHCADVTFDTADRLIPAGKPLWLTLCLKTAVDLLWLGEGKDSRIELLTGPADRVLPDHLQADLAFMKHRFRELSEARPWGSHAEPEKDMPVFSRFSRELFYPMVELRRHRPDDRRLTALWIWTHKSVEDESPVAPKPVAGCDGAPRWALLQRELFNQCRDVLYWWIANRQAPNGEFGDDWGDDTDLCQNFAKLILLGDPGDRLKNSLRLVADGVYKAGRIKRGINRILMDTLHAYEEGVNAQPVMALADYGNPVYLERMMEATRTVEEFLTTKDAKGRRRFRSSDFGADEVRDKGRYGVDRPGNALFCHPGLFLCYYNRNPRALRLVQEWIDGWLDYYATATPPKKETPFPSATLLDGTITSWDTKARGTGYVDCYAALYQLTGEQRYVDATRHWTGAGGPGGGFMRGGHYLPALDIIDREKWKAHIVKWADEADLKKVGDDDMGLKARERYARFEVAADEAAAYQALEACVRKMRLTFEAHTWGEPIDDRIWLPDHPVLMMAAGEIPHERNQLWPRHYVSYAGFSDYAAWVREKSDTRLRVWLYSFADAEESGFVRFWRAPLGEYEVLFGPDADGDGAPDAATPTRHTLHRSAVLPVRLPPRRLCALHINLVRKSDEDFWKRPDLAVSADDAARAGGGVSVVVHNVGGGPARAAVVRLLDAAGRRLDEKTVPVLEAPLDLVPRTVKVEFAGVPAQGPLAVVLDPDNAIPELNELNNSVRLER